MGFVGIFIGIGDKCRYTWGGDVGYVGICGG